MSFSPALILSRRQASRIRPDLDGLRRVLAEQGDPHKSFRSILIVGTNGKGSTAAMLEAVLRAHGVVTGLYTSPHLIRVEERVRLGGRPVSQTELGRRLALFDSFADLTYFETLTAAAFEVFSGAGIEVAVLEAGMGGSWDATRLAGSAIAGLTNVGSDHSRWLGDDRGEIARDKGRALAAAERAVVGRGADRDLLNDLGAPDAVLADSLVDCVDGPGSQVTLRWDGREMIGEMPLPGKFQCDNLQLAVALAQLAVAAGWLPELDPERVRDGLGNLRWPGRLSTHRVAGREVLVDCAHNLEAARALTRYLGGLDSKFNLIFSCLDDKPVDEMAAVLKPCVAEVAICPLADERAMPVDRLLAAFPGAKVAETPLGCLEKLGDPVLAAGSIRLAGQLLANEDGA
jgi:dihydrofolate synthase/folylpolyglutamate synthase